MDYVVYLNRAGVPKELHAEAIACFNQAKERIKGLLWIKIEGRLFKAKQIAKLLPWGAERLIDHAPSFAKYDIAPAINITCNGDNAPWVETPQGGRPIPGRWMNPDPLSREYKEAVDANYWCKGAHPRSYESRVAWYRRNSGEYEACKRGMPLDLTKKVDVWKGDGVAVYHNNGAWIIRVKTKLFWKLVWETKIGFEIDNMWSDTSGLQTWYPLDGHPLMAAVTSSSLPQLDG